MYKKKLGVRVVTAVTVGSLLCSNASVAMAAEANQIAKETEASEKENVSNKKNVTVKFLCDGQQVDEYEFTTQYSATKVSRKDLEKALDSNYKLADETTEWFEYGTGYDVELEVEVVKVEKDVEVDINYYLEGEGDVDGNKVYTFPAGTTELTLEQILEHLPNKYAFLHIVL